jgi:hypothetical protein
VRALASLRRLGPSPLRLCAGVRAVGLPLPLRCRFRFIVVRLVDRAFSRVRAVFLIFAPVFGSFSGGLVVVCAVAVTLLCVKPSSGFGASAANGSPWLNTWLFDWVRRTFRQGKSELWRWFGTTRSLAEERTPHQMLLLVAGPSKIRRICGVPDSSSGREALKSTQIDRRHYKSACPDACVVLFCFF